MSLTLDSAAFTIPTEPALIAPNAVTHLRAAFGALGIDPSPVFRAAGTADWLIRPPVDLIEDHRIARLHRTVRDSMPFRQSSALLADAGARTADDLLAQRIPLPARAALKTAPARVAAVLAAPAIRAFAGAFCGSGRFDAHSGKPAVFTITGNPMIRGEVSTAPVCVWHAAVLQRLFQVLVSRSARAVETDCEASGGACCRFTVDW